jgi:hypothetical protein
MRIPLLSGTARAAIACSFVILAPGAPLAQEPAARDSSVACQEPPARQFDFWLGDWAITQRILRADGTYLELPASTSVSRALDGCALVERWVGQVQFFWEGMRAPGLMHGFSVRAFDPDARVWRIHWMDTRTPTFGDPYVGVFSNGRGEFFRDWTTPQGQRRGRITFEQPSDSTVHWTLAISSDGGTSWQTIWEMVMRRR